MRVSTSMLYQQGMNQIQNSNSRLMDMSLQASSGRKVNKPSDDPIAASRLIDLEQAKSMNTKYIYNVSNAQSALGLVESTLSSVTDLLGSVRETALQAINSTITMSERSSMAGNVRGQFHQLLGLANADDGEGQSLFSGFKGDVKEPFIKNVDALEVEYVGDDGQRVLKVADARTIPVSFSGADVFMNIPGINPAFRTVAAAANVGTAQIDLGKVDVGSGQYGDQHKYEIEIMGPPGPTQTYTLKDMTAGGSVVLGPALYESNKTITFSNGNDKNISFNISGSPANGDKFSIESNAEGPSKNDMFSILKDMVSILGDATNYPPQSNAYNNALKQIIGRLDAASDNVMRVRATGGAHMNEAKAMEDVHDQRRLQFANAMSDLQDVDYTKVISDINQQQVFLQAAQQTYMKVTGMSLFNYLN